MFRRTIKLPLEKNFYLSVISGVEAGVATTTAIIAGTLTSTDSRRIVLISSLVALAVQAFNSAMTHITTAHTVEEIEDLQTKDSIRIPLAEAGVQFGTHVAASLMVLSPIAFFDNLQQALVLSVGTALVLLFSLGLIVGFTVHHKPFQNAIQTMTLGALVIVAGFIAGLIIQA